MDTRTTSRQHGSWRSTARRPRSIARRGAWPAAHPCGRRARGIEYTVRSRTSASAVLPLEQAVQWLAERKPLPPTAVAIPFDDGYADNLAAARILAKYGTTATFYITAGCLAGGQPFWPSELRYLGRAIAPPRVTSVAGPARLDPQPDRDAGRAAAGQQAR